MADSFNDLFEDKNPKQTVRENEHTSEVKVPHYETVTDNYIYCSQCGNKINFL